MQISIFQFSVSIFLFSVIFFMIGVYLGKDIRSQQEYKDNNFLNENYYDLTKDGVKKTTKKDIDYDRGYDKGYSQGFQKGYEECFSIHYLKEKRKQE